MWHKCLWQQSTSIWYFTLEGCYAHCTQFIPITWEFSSRKMVQNSMEELCSIMWLNATCPPEKLALIVGNQWTLKKVETSTGRQTMLYHLSLMKHVWISTNYDAFNCKQPTTNLRLPHKLGNSANHTTSARLTNISWVHNTKSEQVKNSTGTDHCINNTWVLRVMKLAVDI